MNHFLQKPANWFFSDYQFKFQTRWFKNLLYIFLIVKTIVWLVFYDLYFGAHPVIFSNYFSISTFKDTAFLLYANSSPLLAYAFLIPLFVLCLLSLGFRRHYFILDFVTWFLVINLNNKIYPTLTGGDYLLNQFLLFNCFLSASFTVNATWFSDLKICLHNLALVAVVSQVCLVYFLSALAKCNDVVWVSGNAIKDLSMVHHFNLYSSAKEPPVLNSFCVFINYLVLFYQLLFPAFIWIKKIKKPFIMVGLLMHLYIALVMGLVEFGFIMIMAYIYFWPFKKTVS